VEQQQLHDVYKKGLELKSQTEKDSASLKEKYKLSAEFIRYVQQNYKWAGCGS
jgi:hypothetical protein